MSHKNTATNHSSENGGVSAQHTGLPELLAPAGGPEAGYAALEHGADAVYLGLSQFSARAEAVNFTQEQLADLTGYAHHLGRRVYITINTLVQQRQLSQLIESLIQAEEAGADALIVQDLGVLHIARKFTPTLALHASTQMTAHNLDGVRKLASLGVKRVVLARELTLKEIAAITTDGGVQTEVFVHGALCYGYSGQCLFSSHRTGRSANRGRCAYPCRDFFQIQGQAPDGRSATFAGHALSLKDLSLAEHMPALLQTGVHSLKIEGRKKSPLYVAAVVRMYRNILDHLVRVGAFENGRLSHPEKAKLPPEFEEDRAAVETVFSRATTSFFTGSKNAIGPSESKASSLDTDTVGHRGARIGTVQELVKHGKATSLRFTCSLPLEKHDGLQLDIPGQSRPFGFAVDELFIVQSKTRQPKPAFTASAGQMVEVPLPPDHPPVEQNAVIYRASSQEVKRRLAVTSPKPGLYRARIPIHVSLSGSQSGGLNFSATIQETNTKNHAQPFLTPSYACGISAQLQIEENFEPARSDESMQKAAHTAFHKTGDTPFTLESLQWDVDGALPFIPMSQLNEMRRNLYQKLELSLTEARSNHIASICKKTAAIQPDTAADQTATANMRETEWSIKISSPQQLADFTEEDFTRVEELVYVIGLNAKPEEAAGHLEQLQKMTSTSIRLCLPILCRAEEKERMQTVVTQLLESGYRKWEVAALWSLQWIRDWQQSTSNDSRNELDIGADWSIYTLNGNTLAQLKEIGIRYAVTSPEDDAQNLTELLQQHGNDLVLLAYQHTPLLTGEACPRAALSSCSGTPERCENTPQIWHDRSGKSYRIQTRQCRTFLYDTEAWCIWPEACQLPALKIRADFSHTVCIAADIHEDWQHLQSGRRPKTSHSGNFRRTLL